MLTRNQFQALYDQGPDAVYALFQTLGTRLAALEEQNASLSARVQELQVIASPSNGHMASEVVLRYTGLSQARMELFVFAQKRAAMRFLCGTHCLVMPTQQ